MHFARLLLRLEPAASPEVLLAGTLACRSLAAGDMCLDLSAIAARHLTGPMAMEMIVAPPLTTWERALRSSSLVGMPGEFRPLILDARHRLYLQRNWRWEQDLACNLIERAQRRFAAPAPERVRVALQALFTDAADPHCIDWQAVAALVALLRGLCVISGGPGTGKTHTIARILALLQHLVGIAPRRMLLAAPTGKAAARLNEAIQQAHATLRLPLGEATMPPSEAMTVHRLLGIGGDMRSSRYDLRHPLPAELVVVDEASMVDVPLLSQLVAAVAPHARLILVGDHDQLASVEAGAALGDICHTDAAPSFTSAFARELSALSAQPIPANTAQHTGPIADSIVMLQRNRRFAADSAIDALSQAVRQGDANTALRLLRESDPAAGIQWWPLSDPYAFWTQLARLVEQYYPAYLQIEDPRQALERFGRLRVLCAVRGGPLGVEELNRRIETLLGDAGLIEPQGRFYRGQPLLVTANDYSARLFNGEQGLLLTVDGQLRACFPAIGSEALRAISPWRLPAHETAFALTVHKSQGSEFETVLLVLPEQDLPLLSRELLYTAITRATRHVIVAASEPVLRAAIGRRIERSSGLRDALQGKTTQVPDQA